MEKHSGNLLSWRHVHATGFNEWCLPNKQHTLNKLPPELRRRNFVNNHRLSTQVGAKRGKNTYATCTRSGWASILCMPPLVVGVQDSWLPAHARNSDCLPCAMAPPVLLLVTVVLSVAASSAALACLIRTQRRFVVDVIPKVEWELYGDNGVRKRPLGGSGVGSGSTALPDCMSDLCRYRKQRGPLFRKKNKGSKLG